MSINIFRGDAVPVRQIVRIGPPPVDQLSGRFEFEINGKTLAADGWDAAEIATAWNALAVPEFREVRASGNPSAEYDHASPLVLTGPADGTPFDVAVTATGFISIETTQQGADPENEVQRVTIPPSTAGTFTLTFNGQTTAGIAYNATAEAVQSALVALSNIDPGDVRVTGFTGGPWDVEFRGQYAAIEVAELEIDTTGLSLNTAAFVAVETLTQGIAGASYQAVIRRPNNATHLWYRGQSHAFPAWPTVEDAADIKTFLDGVDGRNWTVTLEGTSLIWHAFRITLPADQLAGVTLGNPNTDFNWGTSGGFSQNSPNQNYLLNAGFPAHHETQRVSVFGVTGGTFTLTFDGQTTDPIAHNTSAADVTAALEALSNVGEVDIFGADGGPWTITFRDPGFQNVPQMAADGSSLTAAGTVAEVKAHFGGLNERQKITLPGSVTGGTFQLLFGAARTADIAFNATAATIDAALESIAAIGSGGVTVDGGAGGPWIVTFSAVGNVPALQGDASGLTVNSTGLIHLSQAPAGPTHWNDPLNWTQGRPPETGDEVWLDQPQLPLLYSLRQRTGFALHSANTETLIADGPIHFADGQAVTLRTTGTLPGGLSPGTYYVVDPDPATRLFKLSETRGGTPVNLTSSTGSGSHTAVVELDELHVTARFSSTLGLPRRNQAGYWEYRPQYLEIGFAPAGNKLLKIGEGDGDGSGRIKIHRGTDASLVRIVQTGGPIEAGTPACLILGENDNSDVIQLDGDVGLAAFPAETCRIRNLDVRGGSLFGGEGLAIVGEVTARPGSVRGRYLDSTGVTHRWE